MLPSVEGEDLLEDVLNFTVMICSQGHHFFLLIGREDEEVVFQGPLVPVPAPSPAQEDNSRDVSTHTVNNNRLGLWGALVRMHKRLLDRSVREPVVWGVREPVVRGVREIVVSSLLWSF